LLSIDVICVRVVSISCLKTDYILNSECHRQADILERKRLKKLRQKVQRTKEFADGEKVDSKVSSLDTSEGSSGSTGTPRPKGPSKSELNTSEASLDQDLLSLDPMGSRHSGFDANLRQPLYVEDADQNSGHQMQIGNERWKPINTSQRVLPKQTRNFLNGFHTDQVPATKSFGSVRHINYRE